MNRLNLIKLLGIVNKEFLTEKEASELYKIPYRTLCRWIANGRIKIHKFKSDVLIDPKDIPIKIRNKSNLI